MNKDYVKGLTDGHVDGETGENKLPSRALKRLLRIDQVLPGAQNRHDQYRKGYVQGNEDEGRMRSAGTSLTRNPLSADSAQFKDFPKEFTMSANNSIEAQLQLLRQMLEYLNTFNDFLDNQANRYQSRVGQVGGEGMLQNLHSDIETDMQQTRQRIRQMIVEIETNDMNTVQRWIGKLESLI